MAVFKSVEAVLTLVLMISAGYVFTLKGWFDEKTSKTFSRIMMTVAIPGLILSNLTSNFDRESLLNAGLGFFIPIASICVMYLIGMLCSRVLKIRRERRGTFRSMSAFSNSVFIGIPVCTALFGEKSIGYVLMYYLSSLLLFWTIGAYGISKDAPDSRETEFSSGNMKRIFSPPLIAFLLTVALIMFGIKAPGFILNAGKYMGELSTPMSMLMIGAIICSMGLRSIKLDRDAAVLMILRFIVAPLLVFSLVHFVPAPVLMKKVFVIESALPVQAQTAIVTNAYDADSGYAAGMITITTITGLMFIPLYMLLANYV